MPKGLLVFHWDERIGAEVIGTLPSTLKIDQKVYMQIFMNHEGIGEPGMISFTNEDNSFASYFAGKDSYLYVVIALKADEEGDVYEKILAELAREVVPLYQREEFENIPQILLKYFKKFAIAPSLSPEQKILQLFANENNRQIIDDLKRTGALLKSELLISLQKAFGSSFTDINTFLDPFLEADIIKVSRIKTIHDDGIFYLYDLVIFRTPSIKLLESLSDQKQKQASNVPALVIQKYKKEVKTYFEKYQPSEKDGLNIARSLNETQVWKLFSKLRENILSKQELDVEFSSNQETIETVVKILKTVDCIVEISHNDTIYYGLKSDILIEKIFVTNLINLIQEQYRKKAMSDLVLLRYCEIIAGEIATQVTMQNSQALLKKCAQLANKIKKDRLGMNVTLSPWDRFQELLQQGRKNLD